MRDIITTLGTISFNDFLDLINQKEKILQISENKVIVDLLGQKVHIRKYKIDTIAKEHSCAICGIKAQTVAIEKIENKDFPFFINIYSTDKLNKKVLMTIDHIYPLKLGGPDIAINMQTMCEDCNYKKFRHVGIIDIIKLVTREYENNYKPIINYSLYEKNKAKKLIHDTFLQIENKL